MPDAAVIAAWRGVAVELTGPADLVRAIVGQLPPFYGSDGDPELTVPVTVTDGLVTVHLDDDLSYTGPDTPETHRAAASRIELALVDRLPELTAVHAGVVATDAGVILLPGRSMAGKSTLTRALIAQGATYLSDEFALVDRAGQVLPYPRAMTIRTAAGSERHVPDHAAGPDDPARPAALVAVLSYGAAWEARALTPGEATMALIDNCVSVRRHPARSLTALTALAEGAAALTGTRAEAAEAATHLLSGC